MWDILEADWEEGFACLEEFINREGHARVSASFKTDNGFNLGGWVGHRRTNYRMNQLAPEYIQRLESLPGWVWNVVEAVWKEGFAHLEAFVSREGHARVPQSFKTESGFNLGGWVGHRRRNYRMNQLTEDNIKRLESLAGCGIYLKLTGRKDLPA